MDEMKDYEMILGCAHNIACGLEVYLCPLSEAIRKIVVRLI